MDRVFLDANVLFSTAWRADSGLVALWSLEGATLVTSKYAVEEVRRNLEDRERSSRLDALLASVEIVGETSIESLIPESVDLAEKDRPVLASAIASRSTHLLTGDLRHFGHLIGREVGGVRIVRPATYLRSSGP